MARPTKYDDEVAKKICSYLRQGNTRRAACAAAGISDQTFANWQKRYLDFLERVKKAEAEAETAHVEHIAHAARTSWQASAWWLERRHPKDWKKPDEVRHEHSGPDGGPIKTETTYTADLSRLSDEELRDLDRLIRRAANA